MKEVVTEQVGLCVPPRRSSFTLNGGARKRVENA